MNGNRSFSTRRTGVGAEFKFSRLILALAPVFVTFLVQLMIWPIIWPFAWFLFSPALFLSAWIGGWRLGIVASVIATLLVWFFFLPLERSAVVERPAADIVSATLFMGIGIVFSLFRDRLKRAQRAVAEALATSRYRAQLESVFQAIQDGIVVTDMKGAFILLNEAEARINGFPSAEAMKQNLAFYRQLYELSYPDGTPLPFEEWPINKVLKGESISNFELRARRRDTGQWALPMGKMEIGETPTQCAVRETQEETGVLVEPTGFLGLYSDPRHIVAYTDGEIRQAYEVMLTARPVSGSPAANDEASDVGWFTPAELESLDIHETQWRQLRDYLDGAYPHVD